jgi:ubiquinone/menaquinone biosynthesis C-methylase UbiE
LTVVEISLWEYDDNNAKVSSINYGKKGVQMTIDFHDNKNKNTYTTRQADNKWLETLKPEINKQDYIALDLGCGGGIYSKALLSLGASKVIGMDFSETNLEGAQENCKGYTNIEFKRGNALQTGLPDQSVDVILERALIHHISELNRCFAEAGRILKENGLLIVQDRTPEDCLLSGSESHIRGYFFEKFPRLINKETKRRHTSTEVADSLKINGFELINSFPFWETRKKYTNIRDLQNDIRNRTGRSILHELSDEEVDDLIDYTTKKLEDRINDVIEESDRWTIWIARVKA